ncbi:MAG: hypothetical protein ACI4SH_08470 [Candidatus Scatosoma sp.]
MKTLLQQTTAYKVLSAAKGRLHHAYLLLFADGKNLRFALKTFAPLFFDESILSLSAATAPEKEAAKKRVASLIEKEAFADCLFFPEEGKKFSVENAEAVAEECTLRPVECARKLFVIGDFSEATKEAQNKLLKLLEEPPEGVCFLLGATSQFSVLPTVLSRVEKAEIPPFSNAEIERYLLRNAEGISNEEAALCAKSCGGVAGKALDLATGGYFHDLLQAARALCSASPSALPALIRQYGDTKYKKELLSLLKILFFDALILKAEQNGLKMPSSDCCRKTESAVETSPSDSCNLAKAYTFGGLIKAQEILTEAEKQLYFNGVFPQILEVALRRIQNGKLR